MTPVKLNNDLSGVRAVEEGQYIRVYKSGDYTIDITTFGGDK